jgi:phospholipase/carboxylesterase
MVSDPHRDQPILTLGAGLAQATAAVILLHGRGASAEDILGLASEKNEPWLSSALAKVGAIVQQAVAAGLSHDRIFVCGFSQGACLSSEFVARNPARYGGLIAFTGGLIGPPDADLHHKGDLAGMPALFSSGDPDPHVPWSRVLESAEQFTAMGAEVKTQRYPGRPHTVLPQEIKSARDLIFANL